MSGQRIEVNPLDSFYDHVSGASFRAGTHREILPQHAARLSDAGKVTIVGKVRTSRAVPREVR